MKLRITLLASLFVASSVACASSPPPPAPAPTSGPTPVTAAEIAEAQPATIGCELVCEGARIEGVDHHAAAVKNADEVVAAMHDDLLACYQARVRTHPRANASLTFDIVIGPDGSVRSIETTGGSMLGPKTVKCMTDRLERGTFAPVYGGGTLRIHVPITLRTTQAI